MSVDKLSKLLRQRILANNKAKEDADLLTNKAAKDIKWDPPRSNESEAVLIDSEDLGSFEEDLLKLRNMRFDTDITSRIDANGRIILGADDLTNNMRTLRNTLDKHKSELKSAGNTAELKMIRNNIAKLQRIINDSRKKTERILQNTANGPGLNEILDNLGGDAGSSFDAIKNNLINILKKSKSQTKAKPIISTSVVGEVSFGAASTIASLQKSIKHLKGETTNGRLRDKSGKFYSLVGLTQLLDSRLEEVIKRNMGTGKAKNVLNYQSGRFARTVSINRITLSKSGYATIFYDWMKYPYETFSPGFAQGNIRTRDPKLLIAKSIREIASTVVSNKFRSVST